MCRLTSCLALLLAVCGCTAASSSSDRGGPALQDDFDPGACSEGECVSESCRKAAEARTSVGCDYYAVMMDAVFAGDNGCFVAFVANTSDVPVHLDVRFGNERIDLAEHARIPSGSGKALLYDPFVPSSGLAPGAVAILFLAGGFDPAGATSPWEPVKCPVPAAVPVGAQLHGSGIGQAFRITSDAPVVAYQMLPYGGGVAAVTGASLLVPTSAWDASYVAVNPIGTDAQVFGRGPSLDIVAAEDDTAITMVPSAPIAPDVGVPSGVAHRPVTFALDRGQVLQLTQGAELSGSTITSNRPIGFWGGHQCTNMPLGPKCCCDHAEQQIPPVRALGSEYVAVPHRPRLGGIEPSHWRLVGAAAGTTLAYDPPNAGPATLELGQVAEFTTTAPFVVRSQDGTHPFVLLAYMTSADAILSELGYGDADFVRVVPPAQYLDRYVFFTDPTYPETNLVVVRKGSADVTLDCRGAIDGWAPIGDGNYSYARVDLVRHDFQPQAGCDNGRREMSSTAPFGLWVWGWGTPETVPSTGYVSYGYPAGEGLILINDVELPPVPK